MHRWHTQRVVVHRASVGVKLMQLTVHWEEEVEEKSEEEEEEELGRGGRGGED